MPAADWDAVQQIARSRPQDTRPSIETATLAVAALGLAKRLEALEARDGADLARTVDAQTTLIAGLHDRIVFLESGLTKLATHAQATPGAPDTAATHPAGPEATPGTAH